MDLPRIWPAKFSGSPAPFGMLPANELLKLVAWMIPQDSAVNLPNLVSIAAMRGKLRPVINIARLGMHKAAQSAPLR